MASGQSTPNSVLVGKIVNWSVRPETDECPERFAGHGEIIAALSEPLILVRCLQSRHYDDDEPSRMIVLSLLDPTLYFFDDEDALYRWLDWLGPPLEDQPKPQTAPSSSRRH